MRNIFYAFIASVVMLTAVFAIGPSAPTTQEKPAVAERPGSSDALQQLKDGNERFVADKAMHPRADAARRQETVKNGQQPVATILACSDSRESLEIIFDQGIGDIFAVRVAGNVADTDEIGSIEYGTEHLGTPLLVVLGHSKCGAVTAVTRGDHADGSIPALLSKIAPAVQKARAAHPNLADDDLTPYVIEANVWQSIEDIFYRSEIVRHLVKDGKLQVVGGIYDLESGKIDWLGEHPDQAKLLAARELPAENGEGSTQPETAPSEHPMLSVDSFYSDEEHKAASNMAVTATCGI